MSPLSNEIQAASLLQARWVRASAAAVMVGAGLMAATTAMTAWADRPDPATQATAQARSADHDRHGPGHFHRAVHRVGMEGGLLMCGPRLERLLDEVKATDAQRQQIRSISDAAQADLAKLHESGRQLQTESLAILTQPTIDARAAEALRQKMLAQHDAVTKRLMTAMLDTAKVLTPEQRTQVAERLKAGQERHDHWGEHHQHPAQDAAAPNS